MSIRRNSEEQDVVQLEIGIDKIESLFNKGELCAAEISCLNCESKKCIWNLCLSLCAKRMACKKVDLKYNAYCEKSAESIQRDHTVLVHVKQEIKKKLL